MAGHELDDDPKLKGLSRYFNNTTLKGRANVSLSRSQIPSDSCAFLY